MALRVDSMFTTSAMFGLGDVNLDLGCCIYGEEGKVAVNFEHAMFYFAFLENSNNALKCHFKAK